MSTPKSSICHNISAENYFHSPKMPVKDHTVGLRKTMSSFKRPICLLDNVIVYNNLQKSKAVLGTLDLNTTHKMSQSILKMKEMDLMKPKTLYIAQNKTNQDKNLSSDLHTRQTNPGYSRNKFGGFYTK